MNDELIKQLKEECTSLYPNGCPIAPRGSGKTYLYLSHTLRYCAYQLYIQIYECCNYQVTLESAHDDINKFVAAQMPV